MKKSNIKLEIPSGIEQIGIFSDVHGNDENLSLMHNKHPEIKSWFCLGDAIDMNSERINYNKPTLRKMLKWNMSSIYGNHENEVIYSYNKLNMYIDEVSNSKNPNHLIDYLLNMPFSFKINFNGYIINLFHSTPLGVNEYIHPEENDESYFYKFNLEIIKSDFIFIGHSHKKFIKEINGIKVINPGALGLEEQSYCILNKLGIIEFLKIRALNL